MAEQDILIEYDKILNDYQQLKVKIIDLINDILKSNNLTVHSVTGRLKDRNSLKNKIIKKDKYNSINEITDIIGIRIITHYENEIDIVANLIENEFIVDPKNSIDKRLKDFDRFGYSSLHYVVFISKERQNLIEYKQYKNVKFEIQVRSLLQHTWAEIEHDFGYKAKEEIPTELKRSFSRIAALLETADLEFNNLKSANTKYSNDISNDIKNNKLEVELNKITVESFYQENDLLLKLDEEVALAMNSKFENNLGVFESEINKLKYLDIKSLQELIDLLKKSTPKIIKFTKVFTEIYRNSISRKISTETESVSKGISLFYFSYLYAIETLSDDKFKEFISKFWTHDRKDNLIAILKEAYTKI